MKCAVCGGTDFHEPREKSSMEIWRCRQCGHELAVHCHYVLDLSDVQRHELFMGTASIMPNEALKALFKLKKALSFAERFEPARLEEQHEAGKLTWNLGYFLDFEIQQVEAECARIGIPVSFKKAS